MPDWENHYDLITKLKADDKIRKTNIDSITDTLEKLKKDFKFKTNKNFLVKVHNLIKNKYF